MKNIKHFFSFILALIISLFIIVSGTKLYLKYHPKSEESVILPERIQGYLDNYNGGLISILKVEHALATGRSIVFFGSSEFAVGEYTPALPYNFFPERLNAPLLAVGHAGNQSFSIYSQLICTNVINENSKVAIMLSPSWFGSSYSSGTSLESFVEMVPQTFLYHLYNDSVLPVEYKNYLYEYVVKNYDNLQSSNEILDRIYYTLVPSKRFISDLSNKTKLLQNKLIGKLNEYAGAPNPDLLSYMGTKEAPLNYKLRTDSIEKWDSLYNAAIEEQIEASSNNNLGIRNTYFEKYVKDLPCKEIAPPVEEKSTELKDLEMLLKYLSYKKVPVVFFMQPLHPKAYCDLKLLSPEIYKVSQLVEQYHFEYVNLWNTDTAAYQVGTLRDVMHMGDYGWYKVDSILTSKYIEKI